MRPAVQAGSLPAELPDLQIKSKELFGLTSFALSLLLVSLPVLIPCLMCGAAWLCGTCSMGLQRDLGG